MSSSAETPVVSVIVLTYNHERYIEQTVRSVLAQVAPWPVEILVGEDCSTDRTPEILRQLDAEHPGRLTLLLRPKNLWFGANLADCWQRCRGRYIALLDGDDYWTDTRKLAKNVTALEAHPEWSACFHACEVVSMHGRRMQTVLRPERFPTGPTRLEDMFEENPIQTPTVMTYRAGVVPHIPEWHRSLACGDWVLHMLHADRGPIGFLPDVMAVYRSHPNSMMATMPMARRWQEMFTIWEQMDRQLDYQYSPQIAAARRQFVERVAANYEYLQKVERRYRALGLERLARLCTWLVRPSGTATSGTATDPGGNHHDGGR
jgi:glycosyltransferase involved in cell wall biosynthesis